MPEAALDQPVAPSAPVLTSGRLPTAPVFILGRQHCGNTVTTLIVGRMTGCFAIRDEGIFFEHRARLDRMPLAPRAEWIARNMRVEEPDLAARVAEYLPRWAADHPQADALALYLEAMRFLTKQAGASFWCQKGTSYIFMAREILRAIPDARLVYMVRNPYDVCASKKKRFPDRERIIGWAVSWNRGLSIASALASAMPHRVMLVKYEEMVTDPASVGRTLSAFVGVPFDPAILDVPHINPAEQQHTVVAGTKGLNTSRRYYYLDRLSKSEIKALDLMISRRLIRAFYPDLPHRTERMGVRALLGAWWLILSGPFRYLGNRLWWSRKQGYSFFRRTFGRFFTARAGV